MTDRTSPISMVTTLIAALILLGSLGCVAFLLAGACKGGNQENSSTGSVLESEQPEDTTARTGTFERSETPAEKHEPARKPAKTDSGLPSQAMQGKWMGKGRIIVTWCQQKELPVSIEIDESGGVSGKVGDATITKGELTRNSKLLVQLGNKNYLVNAELDGAMVAAEGITRDSIQLIVDFEDNQFQGGFHSSGSKFGGKDRMMLSGTHLVLTRSEEE